MPMFATRRQGKSCGHKAQNKERYKYTNKHKFTEQSEILTNTNQIYMQQLNATTAPTTPIAQLLLS